MTRALIVGGVAFNTMIQLDRFPEPRPQTVFSQGYHETIGETGAGKALNLRRLGLDVSLYTLIGDDEPGEKIRQALTRGGVDYTARRSVNGSERHVNLMDPAGRRLSLGTTRSSRGMKLVVTVTSESEASERSMANPPVPRE